MASDRFNDLCTEAQRYVAPREFEVVSILFRCKSRDVDNVLYFSFLYLQKFSYILLRCKTIYCMFRAYVYHSEGIRANLD